MNIASLAVGLALAASLAAAPAQAQRQDDRGREYHDGDHRDNAFRDDGHRRYRGDHDRGGYGQGYGRGYSHDDRGYRGYGGDGGYHRGYGYRHRGHGYRHGRVICTYRHGYRRCFTVY